MSKRTHYIFLLLSGFLWHAGNEHLYGQTPVADTSVRIPALLISATYPVLSGTDTLNTENIFFQSFTEVLRTRHNVYFKNYGPGSSATISMSGGKSNEVALIWNGIPVSNPMLGLNDYSMIPMSGEYLIRIADMSSASVFGAGAIAGAIILDPVIDDTYTLKAGLGFSSLQQVKTKVALSTGKTKYRNLTLVEGQKAKNNFPYRTLDGAIERLPHAETWLGDLQHHTRVKWNSKTTLSGSIWGRNQFREIPPTLTESKSKAVQEDQFLRSSLTLNRTGSGHLLNIKGYYGIQNQVYEDPNISLHARHRFQNLQLKMDNQWPISAYTSLKYGFHENHFSSISDNYNQRHTQHRHSVYFQITREMKNLPMEWTVFWKPEKISGHTPDWTGSLEWNYLHTRFGRWTIHTSRNIVWPTLNDLYWIPGGNPELIPEKNAWIDLKHYKKWSNGLDTKIKIYHRSAKNWIQWVPRGGIWQPENHHSARIYGLDLSLQKDFGRNLSAGLQYGLTRVFFPEQSERKLQAIYTPVHMAAGLIQYSPFRQLSFEIFGEYTSTRYTLTDHSDLIEPYFLLHPKIIFTTGSGKFKTGLSLNNVLNKAYQGVKNRPMPGRTIELNTQYQF